SHDIIPVDRCPILDPALAGALDAAWAIAEPLVSIGKPLDVQITATDNGLDVDVRGSGPLPAAMIARLSGIAEQHRLARLTRHGELVLLRRPPVITIGAAQITLPPGSFLQATLAGEATLAALVAEHAGHARHVAGAGGRVGGRGGRRGWGGRRGRAARGARCRGPRARWPRAARGGRPCPRRIGPDAGRPPPRPRVPGDGGRPPPPPPSPPDFL